MVMVVSHTVSDRSLARLSYLHQSFKLDGVAASDIVVTLDSIDMLTLVIENKQW